MIAKLIEYNLCRHMFEHNIEKAIQLYADIHNPYLSLGERLDALKKYIQITKR